MKAVLFVFVTVLTSFLISACKDAFEKFIENEERKFNLRVNTKNFERESYKIRVLSAIVYRDPLEPKSLRARNKKSISSLRKSSQL